MTQFHQFKNRHGVDVYVNPANVLYVETHANETGVSFIHLVGGVELAVKAEIAKVVSELQKVS
jgi:hypothetical protein